MKNLNHIVARLGSRRPKIPSSNTILSTSGAGTGSTSKSVPAILAAAFLLGGCAAPSAERLGPDELNVVSEGDTSTWIDLVQAWKQDGTTVISGRVIHRGYGTRVPGHVDVEYSVAESERPHQRRAELQRRKGLSRFLRTAAFRIEFDETPVPGSTVRLRYHGRHHAPGDESGDPS